MLDHIPSVSAHEEPFMHQCRWAFLDELQHSSASLSGTAELTLALRCDEEAKNVISQLPLQSGNHSIAEAEFLNVLLSANCSLVRQILKHLTQKAKSCWIW